MRSVRTIMLLGVCGGSVLLLAGARQDEKPQVIEGLLSKDPAHVKQAKEELLSARRELIGQLKQIIQDPNNRAYKAPSVKAAISILGEMRALEAIDVLAEHGAWPIVHKADEPPHPDDATSPFMARTLASFRVLPSVDALVRIGEPSVAPVFRRLAATRNDGELKACLSVLVWLCEREYLRDQLSQLLAQTPDPDHRLLLEQAVRSVRDEPPVNERNPMWRKR